MSLQTKLVMSFTVLLLAVIAAVGLVASRSIESILVAQTDRTLLSVAVRGPRPVTGASFADLGPDQPWVFETDALLRPFAEIVVAADGRILSSQPSGFIDAADPVPDVGNLTAESGLVFLDSIDGTLRYRANVEVLADGALLVYAAPLRDIATATASLIRTLLIAGGGVLLLGAAATWWTVRRSIRPVDDMVDTAESIAAGDLTRRVPDPDTTTELGRLGGALNEMLTHIEDAVGGERASRERLRQFVADASHELRTPITAISGYVELRHRGVLASPDEEEKAWSRIASESKRMGNLVEELLTLARLGQSHPLALAEVDLMDVARDAAADHAAIDTLRPVEVHGPDHAILTGDPERLHQVVSALLANVRVHTPEGTRVWADVAGSDERAVLTVTDDGPGIPPGSLAKVFDRFYRVDPSRSRRSGGSGLGLAIVAAIVDAHGGSVAASNVPEGGARIIVDLPRTGPAV
jgi:two-component system OmpR family sensor kinase